MIPFEIYIAYIPWKNGGKNRPVLILKKDASGVSVYPITSKYETKSPAIQAKYFKINDRQQAGLYKQSYIDTNTVIHLPLKTISNKKPTGRLTNADKQRLILFLTQ